jgi:hypothetical protein
MYRYKIPPSLRLGPAAILLRARRERPRSRAAEQRDELATLHSITSSARNQTFVPSGILTSS